MWELWKELFLEILDKHAPSEHKKTKSSGVAWITSNIKDLINIRDKSKRKAIITKLEIDWVNYEKGRNQVNIELRNSKKNYYSSKFANLSFPDEWKIARVIFLNKNGHGNIPGNYRPISILPTISKTMQQMLYNQLYNYLTEFGLLSCNQFSFPKSLAVIFQVFK